jgi:hypothetical protein
MFVGMRSLKARCQFYGSSFQVPDLWHEHVSNEAQAISFPPFREFCLAAASGSLPA